MVKIENSNDLNYIVNYVVYYEAYHVINCVVNYVVNDVVNYDVTYVVYYVGNWDSKQRILRHPGLRRNLRHILQRPGLPKYENYFFIYSEFFYGL